MDKSIYYKRVLAVGFLLLLTVIVGVCYAALGDVEIVSDLTFTKTGGADIGVSGDTDLLQLAANALTVNGTATATGAGSFGKDTDTTSYMGRAAIGFVSGLSDFAYFGHLNQLSSTGYALLQQSNGQTYLNAGAVGILFRIANSASSGMYLSATGLGIHNETPSVALDVTGAAKISTTLGVTGRASAGEQGLPGSAVGDSAGNIYFDDDTRRLHLYSDNSGFGWGHYIQTTPPPDEITATSEGVAASIETMCTEVTTNGDTDLDNVTLANGTSGQIKRIYCVAQGNPADTWKITPANMCGGTQITFSNALEGEGCTLVYADNEGWVVTGNNGGTVS